MSIRWAYGVTTVPSRLDTTLPMTLISLRTGGFPRPQLFVDDCSECYYEGSPVCRGRKIGAYGNWLLGLWELYLRDPLATYYAMFQDDFVCYANLRQYLEKCEYPKTGYWNLYTFPENVKPFSRWYLSNQEGKGAVALVFSNQAVQVFLGSKYPAGHPQTNEHFRHKAIDMVVKETFRLAGWQEHVHNPSLVQHIPSMPQNIGKFPSTVGNRNHPESPVFWGEDYDALDLLNRPCGIVMGEAVVES